MAGQNANNTTDLFEAYFRRADLDGDGQISGAEAVAFFQGSNLPKPVLAQVWSHADQRKAGFLNRAEFFNALKLVTVAQSKRELTPDIVKAALYGPASSKIPAPQINLAATPSPHPRAPAPQLSSIPSPSPPNVGVRGSQGLGNAGTNQQFFPSQPNHFGRPPQAMPTGTAPHSQQVLSGQGMPGGTMAAPRPPSSNVSTDWHGGGTGGPLPSAASQIPNRGISPTTSTVSTDWLSGGPARPLAGTTSQASNRGISPPTSSVSTDWLGGITGGPSAVATSQLPNRGVSPSSTQDGFGLPVSSLPPSIQPRPPATSGQRPTASPKPQDLDSKALVHSGNGASDSLFGDVFSASSVQPKQDASRSSASSLPVSTVIVPASSMTEPFAKPSPGEPLQGAFSPQTVGVHYQQGQSAGKQNLQFAVTSAAASALTGFPAGAVSSASTQPHVPWPKMTQPEVQKYTKVFVQVDTDRDGKITGEQARNLFLSWRLPREVLKQVWDLSDQDNDSMLSLKEFCIALYLMERYREGRPLPTMLPNTIMPDEALFSTTGHPTAPHGSTTWRPVAGLQHPQGTRPPTGKPPRPVPVAQPDRTVLPALQKPKVPELEKPLVDQLSKEEQDSLNVKLKEATDADNKVEELEKEIVTSREKIQFYHVKMQELILYKSKCDNRLNEITERVSGDKREVELLAKKYEEKYKQSGDVASKLTLEEATFRDIQEKKMELYQAIVKMGGDSGDGNLQQHSENIQKELEELVKNLNERCKQYGLRAKPTSLVELPFGWQPGIQQGTADWDEDWDKFEAEGFTLVKELTLDVQNVVAPPKSSSVQKETTSTKDDANASSSNADAQPEKDASSNTDAKSEKEASANTETKSEKEASTNTEAESEKDASKGEEILENELANERNGNSSARSPTDSPVGSGAAKYQSQNVQDSQFTKDVGADDSPHAKETRSDQVDTKSVFSGDKGFDEPSWGTFDTHYDSESVWGFDTDNAKDTDRGKHVESSMFGLEDFGLKPIRTDSSNSNNLFLGKSSIFADSVPSTPAYSISNSPQRFSAGPDDYSFDKGKSPFVFADSVPSTPAYSISSSPRRFSAGPNDYSFDKGKSPFVFADSVPSTPAYSTSNSPRRFSRGSEDHSFDNFSRFDSSNMHDSGFFQSPRHSSSRFDSDRSTRDSDQGHGLSTRFDSFNTHDSGFFQSSQSSLSRFDSMSSSKDFDPSHAFPAFDDKDPFGSTGLSKTSGDSNTQNKGSGFLAFDDAGPFGSTEPFKTSVESKAQNKRSDNWSAF